MLEAPPPNTRPVTVSPPLLKIPPTPTLNPLAIDALFATLKLSVTLRLFTCKAPIFATGASIPPMSTI